jgi:hypothetical protein
MAVDFQVVFPQESVKLNAIRRAQLGGVQALRMEGQDFRAVDEVLINNIEAPEVIVLSPTELVAQLPDALQDNPDVNSVVVLSRRFTVSERSLFRFRIGERPGKVRGILRLLQLFIKMLLTTPGTDIFRPNAGGGVLSKVGATFGADEENNLVTDFVVAQIIAMQSRDSRSPRDERLLSATVVGTQFDKLQGAMYVAIEVVSQAGQAAVANVEV